MSSNKRNKKKETTREQQVQEKKARDSEIQSHTAKNVKNN